MHGEFDKHMGDLLAYFKINFVKAQKEAYEKALRFIPDQAMGDIVRSVIEERRPTPGNFPTIAELKARWYDWRRQHPEHVEKQQFQPRPCDSCGSRGILSYRGEILTNSHGQPLYDYLPTLSAICGDCDNWKRHLAGIEGCRVYTKRYILEQGWELWPFDGCPARPTKAKPLYDMVGSESAKTTWIDYSDPDVRDRIDELKRQAESLEQAETL